MDSSSNERGPLEPLLYEFRLGPEGVSEYVMVSNFLGCYFVLTSEGQVMSQELAGSVLDILCKAR